MSTTPAFVLSLRVFITGFVSLGADRALNADAGVETHAAAADLLQLSLEELGTIQVTSVSKKSEKLSRAAAAIHVITQEDIRRSGVNFLPEALRMAPGLEVARANSRQWAISSRGFNHVFANKLLVLQDGRTIYTPLFSGVFWEETDTVLEDVDRIEVIRGPGATQWGANAVNGVINISTKSAKDTQGLLISGGGGVQERGFGIVRYGGQLATNLHYRVYSKYSNHDEFTLTNGQSAADDWWMYRTGGRLDWEPSDLNRLTLQGDYHNGVLGGMVRKLSLSPPGLSPSPIRDKAEGGNILARWNHEFTAESALTVQMYYDRTARGYGIGREIRDTIDVDAQHRFPIGARNEIVWGAGYRFSVDEIAGSADFMVGDPRVGLHLFSAFAQDEITLAPDRLRLMLGAKLERNDFTGFEVQPSARLAWTLSDRHTIWGSVSRAVRTPSRLERDVSFYGEPLRHLAPLPLPPVLAISGNSGVGSEELLAYEVGYRTRVHPRLSVDWTAFYSQYDHLRDALRGAPELRFTPAAQAYLYIPLTGNNELSGEAYGTEAAATWQPKDFWRLRLQYTLLRMNLDTGNPKPSPGEADAGMVPQHQVMVWSDVDLGRQVEWGVGLRHVGKLPLPDIPAYTELDMRVAWKPKANCELAIIGRNLLHSRHREFAPNVITIPNVEVDRVIYAKLTLRF